MNCRYWREISGPVLTVVLTVCWLCVDYVLTMCWLCVDYVLIPGSISWFHVLTVWRLPFECALNVGIPCVSCVAATVAVWLCGCWAGATECQMKSEPQFRTCLTQTCAKLGSDFSCWVVDAFCLLLLCFVCFCFLCEQKSILPHVESKIENYFWHW